MKKIMSRLKNLSPRYWIPILFFGAVAGYLIFSREDSPVQKEELQTAEEKSGLPKAKEEENRNFSNENAIASVEPPTPQKATAANESGDSPNTPLPPEVSKSHVDKKLPMDERVQLWEKNYKKANKERLKRLHGLNPETAETLRSDIEKYEKVPPHNHPMTKKSADPIMVILKPNATTLKFTLDGVNVVIQAWPEQNFYKAKEVVKIIFKTAVEASRGDESEKAPREPLLRPLSSAESKKVLNILKIKLKKWQSGAIRDINQPLPSLVADEEGHLYSLKFQIDPSHVSTVAGSYDVNLEVPVEFSNPEDFRRNVNFSMSEDFGHFTGDIKDKASDGRLIVSVAVEILKEGNYTFMASLYSQDNQPIANVDKGETLAPGTHWIDFDFYGLLFHERNDFGPFVLNHILFKRIDDSILYLGDEKTLKYQTKAYNPGDFTKDSWGNSP